MDKGVYLFNIPNGKIDGVITKDGFLKFTSKEWNPYDDYSKEVIENIEGKKVRIVAIKFNEYAPIYNYLIIGDHKILSKAIKVYYEGIIEDYHYCDCSSSESSLIPYSNSYCHLGDDLVKMVSNNDNVVSDKNWFVMELSFKASKIWKRWGRRTYLNLFNGDELIQAIQNGTGVRCNQTIKVFGSWKNALKYVFEE